MDTLNRSVRGRASKANGEFFESMILDASHFYETKNIAVIHKTPEPMHILKPCDRKKGTFIACFAKQAQPDFKGILADSSMVLFDAKHTDAGKITRAAVTEEQESCFERYMRMGAKCFVVISLGFEHYFRVPWNVFRDMKELFGHKYMNLEELSPYEIKHEGGVLRFLDGLELKEG